MFLCEMKSRIDRYVTNFRYISLYVKRRLYGKKKKELFH
jgi:hypothetical protein